MTADTDNRKAWPGWVKATIRAIPTDRESLQSAPIAGINDRMVVMWMILARFANDSGEAWPSVTTLERITGKDRRVVIRIIADGERAGLWTCTKSPGRTTRYRVRQLVAKSPPVTIDSLVAKPCPTSGEIVPQLVAKSPPRTKPKNKSREQSHKGAVQLPFSSTDFVNAWNAYVQHRHELHKPLTPTATRQQLATLADMGEGRAIAAIKHSIAAGWLGIFEPKSQANQQSRHGTRLRGSHNQFRGMASPPLPPVPPPAISESDMWGAADASADPATPEATDRPSTPPEATDATEGKPAPAPGNVAELVNTLIDSITAPRERLRTHADLHRDLAGGFKGRRRPPAEPVAPLSDDELEARREAMRQQTAALKGIA